MRDPYLFDDVPVLKNKLGIKKLEDLDVAETDITISKFLELDRDIKIENNKLSYEHLLKIHKYIFGDIYEWAGQPRVIDIEKPEKILNGLSVDYSYHLNIEKDINGALYKLNQTNWKDLSLKEITRQFSKGIAELWQAHPFREGNTRSILKFASHYAKANNLPFKEDLLVLYSGHLRKALVMASIGEYSEPQYLEAIIHEFIKEGFKELTEHRVNKINERSIGQRINKSYDMEL